MTGTALAELAARCCRTYHSDTTHSTSSGGGSYFDYVLFQWLWQHLRWWSIAAYGGFVTVCGFIRAALSRN